MFPRSLRRLVNAAPDAAMAWVFLITWMEPKRLGDNMISHLMLVMMFEFIAVHSSALGWGMLMLFSKRGERLKAMLGLMAFYAVFVLALGIGFRSWWVAGAFAGLVVNRLLPVFSTDPAGEDPFQVGASWAMSVFVYVVGVNLTLFIPVPLLGLAGADLPEGSGVWFSEPWRPLAFGVLYFGALGILELAGIPDRFFKEGAGGHPPAR